MDLHFGATVMDRENDKLGALQRVIVDSETREVLALVVLQSRAPGEEVIVGIGTVRSADDSIVQLDQASAQFANAEPFLLESENTAPPPVLEEESSGGKSNHTHTAVPPIGAATGVESIAFIPIVDERLNIPVDAGVFSTETVVYATDGEIGRLHHVVINDETNRIFSVVVEERAIFSHPAEIPGEWIATLQTDTIVLSVHRAAVHGSQDE